VAAQGLAADLGRRLGGSGEQLGEGAILGWHQRPVDVFVTVAPDEVLGRYAQPLGRSAACGDHASLGVKEEDELVGVFDSAAGGVAQCSQSCAAMPSTDESGAPDSPSACPNPMIPPPCL
jgi:hypothetical protein